MFKTDSFDGRFGFLMFPGHNHSDPATGTLHPGLHFYDIEQDQGLGWETRPHPAFDPENPTLVQLGDELYMRYTYKYTLPFVLVTNYLYCCASIFILLN